MLDTDFLIHQAKANRIIDEWGKSSRSRFLLQIRQLPFKQRVMWQGRDKSDILRGRVFLKFRYAFGDIIRVSFPFSKHGIFQELGVGRFRKKGSSKEKPMPWIEPTFNHQVPILADLLADEAIKTIGIAIKIKVNGIFEAEIK